MLRLSPWPGRRATLALGAAALGRPAAAQPRFPDRAVRVLVSFPAGGTTDVQMRAFCERASPRLGQPLVVDNRPGASGLLTGQAMAQETRADGHLLAQVGLGSLRQLLMGARAPFDTRTDLTWIIQLTGYLLGVVVRADAPWRDWREFAAYAKANPGRINYGTPGVNTPLHVAMEIAARREGIDWAHVPFRGGAENLQAVLGGQIHAMADSSLWAKLVEEGQLRLLVTFGAERDRHFPAVPTLREMGIDFVSNAPYGIAGPRGMDPAVVRVLHDAFKEALHDPAHLAVLDRYYMPVLYLDSESCAAAARRQYEVDRATIQRLGLQPI